MERNGLIYYWVGLQWQYYYSCNRWINQYISYSHKTTSYMSEKIVLQNNCKKREKKEKTQGNSGPLSHSPENETPADHEESISTNGLSLQPLKLRVHWNHFYLYLCRWRAYSICMCFKNKSVATEDHCSPITQSWTCWYSPRHRAAGLRFDQNCVLWWHFNAWSERNCSLWCPLKGGRGGEGQKWEDSFYSPSSLI